VAKHLEALKASKNSIEFWGNAQPKCPHCGSDFDIELNEAYYLYDNISGISVDCLTCEREFSVETRCSYTFSTDDQEDDEENAEPGAELTSADCRSTGGEK